MNTKGIKSALLNCMNDWSDVHEYDTDAYLVDLPLLRRDGDAVRLLVERHGDQYRVTDRGDGLEIAVDAGLNPDSDTAAAALKRIRNSIHVDGVGAQDYELSVLVPEGRLGCTLLDVAVATTRVEELQVLAQHREPETFAGKVSRRLGELVSDRGRVRQRAPMRLRGDRKRQVTASVTAHGRTAFVQAVGRKSANSGVPNAFYLFDRSLEPRDRLLTALQGRREQWSIAEREDLESVSTLVFPDEDQRGFGDAVSAALQPVLT